MTFYLHDFLIVLILAALGALIYFIKNKKFRIGAVLAASFLFLFNPFRFEQPSGEKLGRGVSRFDDLPSKVEVQRQGFEERQAAEHNQLKKQSQEIENEI